METTSQILAPLRYTVQQEQQRNRVLQNEEAALMRLIQAKKINETELQLAPGRPGACVITLSREVGQCPIGQKKKKKKKKKKIFAHIWR